MARATDEPQVTIHGASGQPNMRTLTLDCTQIHACEIGEQGRAQPTPPRSRTTKTLRPELPFRARPRCDPIGSIQRVEHEIRPLDAADVETVVTSLGLARLYQGDGMYFVAWLSFEPLAHAYLAWTEPPELQDVEVRPEYRRRGLASDLTARAEAEASRRGFDRLRLGVSADNVAAQALYRKCGYLDAGIPPKRVTGTIQIRTGPIEVDDTILTWEKRLNRTTP